MHNSADIPQKIQSEIYPDEKILWDYKPSWYQGYKQNIYFWICYMIFLIIGSFIMIYIVVSNDVVIYQRMMNNSTNFVMIFGGLLIAVFMYFLINQLSNDVYYIITNKRAMLVHETGIIFGGLAKITILLNKDLNINIVKKMDNTGTVYFGFTTSFWPINQQLRFNSIPDIDHVEKLIYNIQNNHQ